jgi:hypothetical protein
MSGLLRVLRVLAPLAVVCGALFAVSCGNNNSSLTTATSYPTSASDVVTLTATAGTIPLPAVSPGNSVTINYIGSSASPLPSPFPSAGITMTTTELTAPPTNAPALTAKNRSILSKSNAVNVTSVEFVLNAALPLSAFNMETLNLAKTLPVNQAYFVELDDLSSTTGTTYINTFPGSAVNSGAVQFTNSGGFLATNAVPGSPGSTSPVILNTTDTYLLQFYYLSNGTPATPTPSPSPQGSASPYPTPTPVVVATTVPLGAAANITLPVVVGGFTGTVGLPAAGSGASITLTGASTLPNGITSVGTNDYPYYIFGFTSTASVAFGQSPALTLQLPTNFSDSNPIYAALCTATACPVASGDVGGPVTPSSTDQVTFPAGSIPGFTGVGTTTQYVIVYTNRGTPAGQSTQQTLAGGSGSIPVPAISASLGTYSSTVNLSGLSGSPTVTVAAQTGLFPAITAIVPNTQTIFYALALGATSTTTTNGLQCGASGCSTIVLTIPQALVNDVAALSPVPTFYVEECTATQCPVSTSDVVALTPVSGTSTATLSVAPPFASDVTSLSTTPTYIVFSYATKVPVP